MFQEFEILPDSLADAQYAEAISALQFRDVLLDFDHAEQTPSWQELQTVAQDASAAVLSGFCEWLDRNFHGTSITIERHEGKEVPMDAYNVPLRRISFQLLQDGVTAIRLVAGTYPHKITLDLLQPQALHLQSDSAGGPVYLKIRYLEGEIVLYFAGKMRIPPCLHSHAWGG